MLGSAQREGACRRAAAVWQARLLRLFGGFRALAEMFKNLFFACPALLVQAEQFVRPLVRFHWAGQLDQKARDQRTVDLDLDAASISAEQVAARQGHILSQRKKQLDQPAIAVQKDDDFPPAHREDWSPERCPGRPHGVCGRRVLGWFRDAHDDASAGDDRDARFAWTSASPSVRRHLPETPAAEALGGKSPASPRPGK